MLKDVADDHQSTANSPRRVRKFIATYVEKGKYGLYPEPEVVENVVQGLPFGGALRLDPFPPLSEIHSARVVAALS